MKFFYAGMTENDAGGPEKQKLIHFWLQYKFVLQFKWCHRAIHPLFVVF